MPPSPPDVIATAHRLQQQGTPYALVSVLRAQAPASARAGDKAIVTAEGIVDGWIGGGCSQPAVSRAVRQALADGRARMIRIAPAAEGALRELDEVLEFGMSCHSGGTLELFVDPVLPRARLTVIGDTPLAAALAVLAPRVGLPVSVVAHGADVSRFPDAEQVLPHDDPARLAGELAAGSFVVVATQGRRDLQALRAALALGARRIFFVASARKAAVLKASLVESGADGAQVAAIVAPAGPAIGAQTPEEIALSVLAAVVAARREAPAAAPTAAGPTVVVAVEAAAAVLAASAVAPCCGGAAPATPEPLPPAAPGVPTCCGGGGPVTLEPLPPVRRAAAAPQA